MTEARVTSGVPTTCRHCMGTGKRTRYHASNLYAPSYTDECEACYGAGYVLVTPRPEATPPKGAQQCMMRFGLRMRRDRAGSPCRGEMTELEQEAPTGALYYWCTRCRTLYRWVPVVEHQYTHLSDHWESIGAYSDKSPGPWMRVDAEWVSQAMPVPA